MNLVILTKFYLVYLTFQTHFSSNIEAQKYVKQCKQLKHYRETCLKHLKHLTKSD